MEETPKIEEVKVEVSPTATTPKKFELSLPIAIIVGAVIIAGALYANNFKDKPKTIAGAAGLNSAKLQACISSGETKDAVAAGIASGNKVFAHLPQGEWGTPYTVLVAKDGTKLEVQGAQQYDAIKSAIDSLIAGKAIGIKNIDLDPVTKDDHILGDINAQVVMVEYTDFECPFCYRFHPTLQKLYDEYGGQVAWVIRNYPLTIHENAYVKAQAAECAAVLGGNDAYFKYVNALFDSLAPKNTFDTTTL